MFKQFLLFILLSLIGLKAFSQQHNYIDYHKEITKAEEFFIKGETEKAVTQYEKTFQQFPKTFARDAIIALQISCISSEKRFVNYFYSKAVLNGIDWKLLNEIPIIGSFIKDNPSFKNQFSEEYSPLHNTYANSLDSVFRNQILYLLYKDDSLREVAGNKIPQDSLKNAMWLKQNESNTYILKKLIDEKGIPGEHATGLLAPELIAFKGRQPYITKCSPVFIRILAHCKCGLQITNDHLLQGIRNGELHPKDYAHQYEWSQNGFIRRSWKNKYYSETCPRTVTGKHYNYFLNSSNYSKDIEQVNKNREEIGMFSLEHYKKLLEFGKENNVIVEIGFQKL